MEVAYRLTTEVFEIIDTAESKKKISVREYRYKCKNEVRMISLFLILYCISAVLYNSENLPMKISS